MANQEPEKPTPYMIALFDVLGFEQFLRVDGLEKIYQKYETLIERAVKIPDSRWADLFDGHVGVAWASNPYAYFSDTILLWQPLERFLARQFVERCANMVGVALEMGIPLRGALSLGPAKMDKAAGIYIGEPIVEAARLEAQQEWIGVGFAGSAMWSNWIDQMSASAIVPYRIPLKSEAARRELCGGFAVNWCSRLGDNAIPLLESLRNNVASGQESVQQKYLNTIAFVKASNEWLARVDREKWSGFKLLTSEQVESRGDLDVLRLE